MIHKLKAKMVEYRGFRGNWFQPMYGPYIMGYVMPKGFHANLKSLCLVGIHVVGKIFELVSFKLECTTQNW